MLLFTTLTLFTGYDSFIFFLVYGVIEGFVAMSLLQRRTFNELLRQNFFRRLLVRFPLVPTPLRLIGW